MLALYIRLLAGLAGFLASIPAAFYGVVFGSFFSLGGVMATNRASEKRLRTQFENDREVRREDREFVLRRDIYLASAEGLYASFAALGQLTNLNTPIEDATKVISEKLSVIAKMYVIGGQEVIETVAKVATALLATLQRLMLGRIRLGIMKAHVDQLTTLMDKWHNDRNQTIELMKTYNLNLQVDQQRWAVISGRSEFEERQFNEALNTRTTVQAALLDAQSTYASDCIDRIHELRPLMVRALIAMRTELNLPLDPSIIERIVQESQETQRADLDAFLNEAREMVAALRTSTAAATP
jgi:hypothetical protein